MNLLNFLLERRGTIANWCLGGVLAGVLVLEMADLRSQRRPWWLDCAAGVAVCGLALARGRSRIGCAVAGLAVSVAAALGARLAGLPGAPGPAPAIALMVLLAAAIRVLPVLPAAAIAAGGGVLAGLTAVLHPDLGAGALGSWWAIAVAAGLLLRLVDARQRAMLDAVRRTERLDLARELHDVAAHQMTAVVLQAQAARIAARKQPAPDSTVPASTVPARAVPDSPVLDYVLADIESAGTGALAAMRRVIGLLRDGDATRLSSGPEQLTGLVERFAQSGIPVRLELPHGPADPGWPPELTSAVYRVTLEALTNVVRHAPLAGQVTVTLAHDQRTVTVDITDDAPAPAPRPFPGSGGFGLTGMRERVGALGGTLSAGPRPGGGWSVRATMPADAVLANRP